MVRDADRCGRGVPRGRWSSAALPKTRSGKILRKTMREIADGKDAAVPSTIEDEAVLDALAAGAPAGRRRGRLTASPVTDSVAWRARSGV
ncbi:MAG: hypothetical protein V9F00_03110 [Nocardioides sp.]